MSLYNMLMGRNDELAVIVSEILGVNIIVGIPRFRDVFTYDEDCPLKKDEYDVLIYTRMGGGNYECWGCGEDYVEGECPYHILLEIEDEEWCIGAYDDSYDCTYRTLIVRFTDEQRKVLRDKHGGSGDE